MKCNSIIKDGKLSISEGQVNKNTIKQIKPGSKKEDRSNIKIK